MARKTTGISFDNTAKRHKVSAFDRIVNEVDATEIPAAFIESVIIQQYDGNIVELDGNELTHAVPVSRYASWEKMDATVKRIRDLRVFISLDKLEVHINSMVEDYLGKFC